MPYTPDTWANNDPTKPLNATRLTKLAGQYPQVMADLPAKITDSGDPIGEALASTIVSVVQDTVGDVEGIVRGGFTLPDPIPADFVLFADAADTEAPTAPASLTATLTTSGVSLSWGASVDNVAVASYKVYRDGSPIALVYALAYQDTTAAWDTTYAYTVKAVDLAGNESPASNSVNVTRGVVGTPTMPTTLGGGTLLGDFVATDFLGLLSDNMDVTTWENRVSDGADLVASAAGAAKFRTGGYVSLDGTTGALNADMGLLAQPVTKFIVFRLPTVVASRTIWGTRTSGANRQIFAVSADGLSFTLNAGSSTRTIAFTPTTNKMVAALRINGASTRVNINGNIFTMSSPGVESGEGIRLGADTTGATRTALEIYRAAPYAGAVADAQMDAKVTELMTFHGVS